MDRRLIVPLLVCLIIAASTGRIFAVTSPLGYAAIFTIVALPALMLSSRRARRDATWDAPVIAEPASE